MASDEGRRGSYLVGVVELAVTRIRYRALSGGARQTLLSIIGVALAIALLLSVTSIGLGLASQGTIQTSTTDYWILPEQSQESAAIGASDTRFGQTHTVAARLEQSDMVAYATPVLIDLVQVQAASSDTVQRVFLVGVIPREDGGQVVGLPTDDLQPGDPYYAHGSYNGRWTGQTVISASAASAVNVSTGERLTVDGRQKPGSGASQSLSVVNISPAQAPGLTQFPVLVVHLAEAQELVGATGGDEADQVHVDTTDPSAKQILTGVYPQSDVVSNQEMMAYTLRSSDLPLAMSSAAGIIALVIGVLTIVTTMGFEIADDTASRAVLAAMGMSHRTRLALVGLETIATTLLGGLGGIGLWLGGIALINLARQQIVQIPVVVFEPVLGVYGMVTALGIGLVSLPVLLMFTRQSSLTEALPSQ